MKSALNAISAELEAIRATGELSKETEAKLAAALESFTKDFLKGK